MLLFRVRSSKFLLSLLHRVLLFVMDQATPSSLGSSIIACGSDLNYKGTYLIELTSRALNPSSM